MQNHGVLPGRRDTDYVAGTLPYEVRTDGNWEPWLPPREWQKKKLVDTMACVTFSLLNCIETQEKQLTGVQIDYSDRWIAMMSETTPEGNYLYKVADAVRKYGLVREESWPTPDTFTWNSYYQKPDPAKMEKLLREGQEWLKTHTFAYEWVDFWTAQGKVNIPVIQKELRHVPLQVVRPGHAIEGYHQLTSITKIFDSYSPFQKDLPIKSLDAILKPILTLTQEPMKLVNDNGTYFLVGEKGKLGFADMDSLNVIKSLTDKEEAGSTEGIPQVKVMEKGFVIS